MKKKRGKEGRKEKRGRKTMKDRNGERVAGESVKVNDPRAAREAGQRGQRLMGRYIPAAERGWIDVGITGISIIWHIEHLCQKEREK